MNISMILARIRLFIPSSHDSESLTERAVLQASSSIVGCSTRLVRAGRMEVRG